MKLVSSLAIAAALAATPVSAADLFGNSSKDAPATASDWTGFYIGGGVGYSATDTEVSVSGVSFDGISADGITGTARIGYDRQMGDIVLGVFAEGSLSDSNVEVSSGGDSLGVDLDYSYGGGVRAGFLRNATLIYALAGYKVQHLEGDGFEFDDELGGWFGGLGIETKVTDRVTLGLEGTYTAFEEEDFGTGINFEPSTLEVFARARFLVN